jgi:hypothetical protein
MNVEKGARSLAMKDHEIAKVINDVTHVARMYGQTQQIRERLRAVLEPVLKGSQPKREPLSKESIMQLLRQRDEEMHIVDFIRYIEKAHGIGVE